MAHIGKLGAARQLENLALLQKQAPQQVRQQAKQAHLASGREHIDLVPIASIDDQAGVRTDLQHAGVDLGHIAELAGRMIGQRYVPVRRPTRNARGASTERKELNDEESAFQDAVFDALEILGEDSGRRSRDQLESQLERYFEPVQRLKVLVQALQELDAEDVPARQKIATGRALNGLITALMKKHPHEIRAALQETEEAGVKVDPMQEELQSSTRLRWLIGAKNMGRFDTPLSPLTVLKALIKNFGGDCLLAMCTLRSRMMSGL